MRPSFDRRRFLRSACALGALGSSLTFESHAATSGHVLLGFQVRPSFAAMLESILRAMQGRYQPDLGTKPALFVGGSGGLSVDATLRAPRDGGTVLIAPSAVLTLLPESRKLSDDPVRRLVPVAGIGETTIAFIVGPSVPSRVQTMSDYFDWVRANPWMGHYAVAGLGTASHFVGREVARSADIELKPASYRGNQPIFEDVVSGATSAAFTVVPDTDFVTMHPTTRVLGVASEQRWPTCPEVPTFKELGLMQGFAHQSVGFFFADGTPAAKIDELAAAVGAATATPEVARQMNSIAMRPMPATDRSYAQVLAEEARTWTDLARRVDVVG